MGVGREREVDLLVRASASFGEQLTAVGPEQWDLPTPCTEWDVRAVAAHIVVGDAQIPPLYAGERLDAVSEVSPTVLGRDPVAAWRGTTLAMIEAFSAPGALDQVLHHPVGDLPGRHVIGFRISDHFVHAWDIAQAIGAALELDPEIAEWCLDFWQPMAPTLSRSGYFGDVQPVDEGSPAPSRLLALLGRAC